MYHFRITAQYSIFQAYAKENPANQRNNLNLFSKRLDKVVNRLYIRGDNKIKLKGD